MFGGVNVWRITELKVIVEIKFGEGIDFGHKVLLLAKIWLVKVWRIMDNSPNSPNFPAAKRSRYTVHVILIEHPKIAIGNLKLSIQVSAYIFLLILWQCAQRRYVSSLDIQQCLCIHSLQQHEQVDYHPTHKRSSLLRICTMVYIRRFMHVNNSACESQVERFA